MERYRKSSKLTQPLNKPTFQKPTSS